METHNPFVNVSPLGQEALKRGITHHAFKKGAMVVDKGQPVSGAYFVTSGVLRVYTITPNGKEATLYLIRPGETCVLALNSLFNNLLYPAWVQAEEASRVEVVPGTLYRRLFVNEPPIQDLTVHALSTVVMRLMAELEEVHSHRVDQRMASYLLNQASGEGVVLKTQLEIASHIGTTREVVAKTMSIFSNRGWVKSGRGRVCILQSAMLAALVRRGELDET